MPLPRLDVRPRRLAAGGAAIGSRGARVREGRARRFCRRASAVWGPFLFVNPDPRAEPLADWLGDLPAILGRDLDLDAVTFHSRVEFGSNANWKVVTENFLECYHCPTAHPGFSAAVDVHPDRYVLEPHATFSSQHCEARTSGERGQFHLLYPNTGINVFPGPPNLSIGPILPDRPGPHRALPRLLLRSRRGRDVARGLLRLRRPGGPRGHRARRIGASRHGDRDARARSAPAERGAADRRLPGLGDRSARRAKIARPPCFP